ncbi:MAG: hypothetical protein AMJ46_00065 [Latescibacteria bacterium DG_63]|nr:MAG: hypothetical protein AMJ46_00065 [Latescibacteria bacterium DG_63]
METRRRTKAFEDVQDQIGFCGIWCGSCAVANGTLRELTQKYEEIIGAYGLSNWGPKDFDFAELSKGLVSIGSMDLCPGCLKGGGRDECEMKGCAIGKGIDDCSACPEPDACEHVELLERMRSGALDVGLYVKTESADNRQLIQKWTDELKVRWPCRILFTEGQ